MDTTYGIGVIIGVCLLILLIGVLKKKRKFS
ncbi:MAG: LPXTG cell wall anchor domain-containing protein [Eubacterium sp.]